MYRLDDLFATERLAFAHLDVEGAELDVLHGGEATILRDRPVFTVEVHVQLNRSFTSELVEWIARRGFSIYLVHERCGVKFDCRNLLCLPVERVAASVKLVGELRRSTNPVTSASDLFALVNRTKVRRS